ncbi:hypothetical protein BKA82DRAFT_452385 [Pisolithus tinctorius]|uniref:Uncharacterized protein n=1 Tax=Pisolithus tinctorius Marx 270 TaxID=870435 RepID=A0A0C3PX22_PISTI|nr:hypothetical protein BKA82DRAFT_452385 [Pisolithus tinctorius]KIO13951.1 hypothetical protein M404DRAFT_452385 [Pisolithus tinctorius Marx 270]
MHQSVQRWHPRTHWGTRLGIYQFVHRMHFCHRTGAHREMCKGVRFVRYQYIFRVDRVTRTSMVGRLIHVFLEAMSHPSPPPAEQSVNVPMRDGYSKLPMDGNEGYDNVYPTAGSGGAQDDMDLLLDESNIEKREEIRNGKRRVASPVENSKTTDDEKDAQGTGFVLKKRRSRQLLENVPESEDEEPASRRRRIFRASQEETSPSSSDQFGMKEHYTRSKHRAPRSPTKPRTPLHSS